MVGADDRADAASAFPVGFDLEPDGVYGFYEVLADGVGDGFEEAALVAEGMVVELEAFELDALAAGVGGLGLVAEGDDAEVWVSCDRADGGELLGDVLDDEGGIGWGFEDFEEVGIWHPRA